MEVYRFPTFGRGAGQERQGFSFLKSVNEKQLADIWQQVNNSSYKLSSGKAVKVSEGDLAEFKEIVQKDGQFVELDGQILNIVGEVSTLFFEGQKSAEEAAKIIQERTIAYLNG
ncbi:hypothetical protein [Brevibacillus sp. SIMBA_040]|uniref:hypothetical protein n=1 Tax=unclassified Brevibacillus TaxID=2684853 RepID=UPI00397DBD15